MTTSLVPHIDTQAFKVCFNRLAKAKRATDVDGATMAIYLETLKVLPMWAIEEAATELARKPTFGFPEAGVWFQAAQEEVARRMREEQVYRSREWKDECRDCKDSGWREHHCTHTERCGRRFCDQLGEKHAHTYYSACPCREHNSTYRRNTLASQLGHGNKESKA